MQIKSIVLYGQNGKIRVLNFELGKVNIITGKSKTGKSVIGDIIEYCLGGSSCNIAEGVVRDKVAWYALQLVHNDEYTFIARENPPKGQSSTNKCRYILGNKNIPKDIFEATPIDNESLEKVLSKKLGIAENLYKPPLDQTRMPLSANIRHTLFYCLQNQDEIASQKFIFHRQTEPFIPQAIKDTLPYFLGIIDENSLALDSERLILKREASQLKKSIDEVEQLKGNGLIRATQLIEEARNVGLLSNDLNVDYSYFNSLKETLIKAINWTPTEIKMTGLDRLSLLQSNLQNVQNEVDALSIDLRNTDEFLGQVRGYNTELDHQKKRLESIGLFDLIDFDNTHCPLCSADVESELPSSFEIKKAILNLSEKLSSVSWERPYLRKHLDSLTDKREELREKSKQIMSEIEAIYNENKEALRLKDINVRRGRIIGRISLWLESVTFHDDIQNELDKLEEINSRIIEINAILSLDEIEDKKQSAINRISSMISNWSKELDLEHSEYPYRFDLNKLTVIVDRNRPVPLTQLGSGSNWLGCHLITLFSFHTFFISAQRPVPSFLFLDQPSQVYFPPETSHKSVDNKEIREIYRFIFNKVDTLENKMQVIIVDHADINEPFFQNAIVEKWWDDVKLVPIEW